MVFMFSFIVYNFAIFQNDFMMCWNDEINTKLCNKLDEIFILIELDW